MIFSQPFFLYSALSLPSFPSIPLSPTIRYHAKLPPSMFCPHLCPSWGCVGLGVFPFPPWSPPFPPRCLFSPPTPKFCHSPNQCLSPLPSWIWCCWPCHPYLKYLPSLLLFFFLFSSRPHIPTYSGWGSVCSPLLSELREIRGRGSSRRCRPLWSVNLCTLPCHLLPLVMWCCLCSYRWKTLLIGGFTEIWKKPFLKNKKIKNI